MAIAAALALCSQLFALAHLWLVPHTRCAEHGETVHDDGHAVQPRIAAPERTDLSASPATPEGATDDGHDHCQLLTDRRELAAERGTIVVRAWSFEGATFPLVERTAPSRAVYRLAPKVSPPATLA